MPPEAGKGVLLSAPHLGNWEVMNHVATMYATVTAMYKPAKIKCWISGCAKAAKNRWLAGSCQPRRHRHDVCGTGKRPVSGYFARPRTQRAQRCYCTLYGRGCPTAKLPHELLLKTGARAVFGFAKRLPDAQGFEVYFVAADEDIYSQDVQVSAASMNRTIAKLIELAPNNTSGPTSVFVAA